MPRRRSGMRKDLIGGGGATLSLMLLAYVLLRSATLPIPSVMTDVTVFVAAVGAGLLVIGIVLPSSRRRRTGGKIRRPRP